MAKTIICPVCNNSGSTSPSTIFEADDLSLKDAVKTLTDEKEIREYIDKWTDSAPFSSRGTLQGKPVWKCNKCGTGLFVRLFGKPQAIPSKILQDLRNEWELRTGKPF